MSTLIRSSWASALALGKNRGKVLFVSRFLFRYDRNNFHTHEIFIVALDCGSWVASLFHRHQCRQQFSTKKEEFCRWLFCRIAHKYCLIAKNAQKTCESAFSNDLFKNNLPPCDGNGTKNVRFARCSLLWVALRHSRYSFTAGKLVAVFPSGSLQWLLQRLSTDTFLLLETSSSYIVQAEESRTFKTCEWVGHLEARVKQTGWQAGMCEVKSQILSDVKRKTKFKNGRNTESVKREGGIYCLLRFPT